jgi:hypothetical protein
MLMTQTWEQTAIYNPNDPTQRTRRVWANPGGYASFYWNRVPDAGVLKGLGTGFSTLPQVAQIGLVTLAAAVAGYAAYRYGKPMVQRYMPRRRR